MSGSPKHIHKYMLVTLSYAQVWRCGHPMCAHHMPKHMEKLVIGRASVCWQCLTPFALDEKAMKEEFPRCQDCREPFIQDVTLTDYDLDKLIELGKLGKKKEN